MKRIQHLLLCAFLFFTLNSYAQLDKSQKALLKEVRESGNYIVGTGRGNTLKRAQEDALSDLASQISTNVSSQFDYVLQESKIDDKNEISEQVNSIIKTYSHTTLRNALEIIVEDEPNATVVRYIKKSDVDKVFEDRRNKAITFAKNAERYEKSYKIGDALSYYYWALSLLRSCPSGDKLKISFGLNEEQTLITYLYNKIKEILLDVQVSLVTNTLEEDGSRTLEIKADYKGQPTANFNYSYSDGSRRSDLCSMQNGEDVIVLPGELNLTKLDLRAEYCCEEEANMDSELSDVLRNTQQAPLKAAKLQLLGLKNKESKRTNVSSSVEVSTVAVSNVGIDPANVGTGTSVKYLNEVEAAPFVKTMAQIENAIRCQKYSDVRQLFTDEGYEMFDKLLHYGNARLIRAPKVTFSRLGNEVTCRSFPMSFTFKTSRRKFSENVVFRLNDDAKIVEVAFGLEERATNDIMNNGAKRYSEEARQVLVNFLESYKSAYALCRLDYLDRVFSNDAIIITGTVVKSAGFGELKPKEAQHVKYTRQTKAQYLKNLERTMNSNEFINIHFADNIVKKSTGKEIYGIQIKQDYFSSSYGDTGYLFLLIDLNDPKLPCVKVRAWQPDLDPSIQDGRLGMQDFVF